MFEEGCFVKEYLLAQFVPGNEAHIQFPPLILIQTLWCLHHLWLMKCSEIENIAKLEYKSSQGECTAHGSSFDQLFWMSLQIFDMY